MSFVATVPASIRWLTTVDNVRLRSAVAEDMDDEAIEAMIASASAAVEKYCGRVFARETGIQTERLGSYQRRIWLERFPVVSITSIVEAGETLTSDDYDVDTVTGELRKLVDDDYGYWSGKVVITYVGGYLLPDNASPTLPADIEEAVISIVGATAYSQTTASTGVVRAEEVEGIGRIEYATSSSSVSSSARNVGSLGNVEYILSRYRVIHL